MLANKVSLIFKLGYLKFVFVLAINKIKVLKQSVGAFLTLLVKLPCPSSLPTSLAMECIHHVWYSGNNQHSKCIKGQLEKIVTSETPCIQNMDISNRKRSLFVLPS